jgi:hypothetical protein
MVAESINQVRKLFEEFRRVTDRDDAERKLQQAADAALDVIDGDAPDEMRDVVRHIVNTYCEGFLKEANASLLKMKGSSFQDMEMLGHYQSMCEAFAQIRDNDPDLRAMQKQIRDLWTRWL